MFSKKIVGLLVGCLLILLLASCRSSRPATPQLEYFQSKDKTYPAAVSVIQPTVTRIQPGDILGIIVSSLDKPSNETLNFYNVNTLPQTTFTPGGTGASEQPLGYPVDSLGNVNMPLVGRQKLGGLTLGQAEERVRASIEKTIKEPAVNIRFMNHKFTVIGEVGHVGTFNLLNDQTTLIEAVTAAGDLSIYGKRDSVKVIRVVGGKREIGLVNLQNRSVFTSPYFYVRNDDIIYVEPTKNKVNSQVPTRPSAIQQTTLFLTILTTLTSLVITLTRL